VGSSRVQLLRCLPLCLCREAAQPSAPCSGLTQRQLAANLNITGPRWANYEVGTSRIPVDVALQLVEKWEVSLDWIYYGNETMMPKQLLKAIKAVAKK
jgi:transcriptional regulator with XRE-family HTH domain